MVRIRPFASTAGRHRPPWVVVAACLAVVALAGCGQPASPDAPPRLTAPTVHVEPAPTRDPQPRPSAARQALPDGQPVRVEIAAIDVDAELVEVGLQDSGEMEVPDFGLAGWYAEGPMPGHPGPAAIAAHVDSRAGPDVFHRLRELEGGEEIRVHYDGGDVVTFEVESSERTSKDELPVERIWPVTSETRLSLITCGGDFDHASRHYLDNVVVYGVPSDA